MSATPHRLEPRPAGGPLPRAGIQFAARRSAGRPMAVVRALRRRPELFGLLVLAGVLDLWALTRNGLANEYYAAAVHSMSTSWHDFLFGSLDAGGVMTVDKPPLALWVQALSVRAFGMHPLSLLVPQALMGVATVALVYDLVRRPFGCAGGFAAGLALALTPVAVAVSRHNNPDALLVLCSVGAVWCAVRALERGRTRWLVLSGVCVGLGFETKMAVAFMVVPGIVAAWMWVAPRGRRAAAGALARAGAAMVVVGGAWPLLVTLTPASDRPWISGTNDNSILSLIFGYNGLGRLDGQTGGPSGAPGAGGGPFGGSSGPLRLLNASLGGQDGWLLGFAVLAGLGVLAGCRLRRRDARTGWLLAVGGAFATTALAFSFAQGIFHPYYISLLAPFTAALTGAGAALLLRRGRLARVLGPLLAVGGAAVELAVLGQYPGQLRSLVAVLIVTCVLAGMALLALSSRRGRAVAAAALLGGLLIAPGVWAFDTLGHAESGTFPAGGPASASADVPGGGGRPSGLRALRGFGGPPGPGGPPPRGAGGPPPGGAPGGPPPGGAPGALFAGPGAGAGAGGGLGGRGGPFGGERSLTAVLRYAAAHGGGTVAVASQSGAATAILEGQTGVAGIGGFSGRESSVSVGWLAAEVASGRIRWVLEDSGAQRGGLPGDTRAGSSRAISAAAAVCRSVTVPATSSAAQGPGSAGASVLLDCAGEASALRARA